MLDLWRQHPREFLIVAAISGGGSAAFYAYTTYMQKFLVNTSGFSRTTATQIMTVALILFMLIQPLWGLAADRFGPQADPLCLRLWRDAGLGPGVHRDQLRRDPGCGAGAGPVPLVLLGSYTAISGLIKAELFPPHIRTLGVALPYAVGNTLFGGTAEYAALWFKQAGAESGFYWYLTAIIGMAAAVSSCCRKPSAPA